VGKTLKLLSQTDKSIWIARLVIKKIVMYELFEIRAKIKLFKGTDVRQNPFTTGYRPLFEFPEATTKISGRIDLIDGDFFSPGQTGIVKIFFNQGIISNDYFSKGNTFYFSEGTKNLGAGEIL
jgi:hypothetical protein